MITIQGFAKLCGCNTQTLRYYDRIGLLTPAKVDDWSGYRYYEEEQAMQFVKIKNLQQADFSIDEIKTLLDAEGDQLKAAFKRKIAEQEDKLEQIKKIQQSYLQEKMEMQKTICMLADFMEERADDPKLMEEFGLTATEGTEISAKVHEILADWMTQIRNAKEEIERLDPEIVKEVADALFDGNQDGKNFVVSVSSHEDEHEAEVPADAVKVFERSGWAHVSEWLENIPNLEADTQNHFQFSVREDSPVCDPGFPIMMLAVMASKYDVMQGGISCKVVRSEDGLNHVTLLQN